MDTAAREGKHKLRPAERRLELLREGEQPKVELRPGIWKEVVPGFWVNLQQSTMHGCEIKLDAREV